MRRLPRRGHRAGRDRQAHAERAAAAHAGRLEPDAPTLRFDELLADRQPEAGAGDAARELVRRPVEPLENPLARLGRNTNPVVSHPRLDRPAHERAAESCRIRWRYAAIGAWSLPPAFHCTPRPAPTFELCAWRQWVSRARHGTLDPTKNRGGAG